MFVLCNKSDNTHTHHVCFVSEKGSQIIIHPCFCTERWTSAKVDTLQLKIKNQNFLKKIIPDWKNIVIGNEVLELKCYFNTVWTFKKLGVNTRGRFRDNNQFRLNLLKTKRSHEQLIDSENFQENKFRIEFRVKSSDLRNLKQIAETLNPSKFFDKKVSSSLRLSAHYSHATDHVTTLTLILMFRSDSLKLKDKHT